MFLLTNRDLFKVKVRCHFLLCEPAFSPQKSQFVDTVSCEMGFVMLVCLYRWISSGNQ